MFQIWREYDSDHSGYIEADELKVRETIHVCICLHIGNEPNQRSNTTIVNVIYWSFHVVYACHCFLAYLF